MLNPSYALPQSLKCPTCDGGNRSPVVCPLCRGAGSFYITGISQELDVLGVMKVSFECSVQIPSYTLDPVHLGLDEVEPVDAIVEFPPAEEIPPRIDADWDF